MRDDIWLVLIVIAALVAVATAPSASAVTHALGLKHASVVEPAKSCPHGYRKSTVTGNCVRKEPRWPILSWF
jgi:hypothetical protein